jgi:hypothetical protein
VAMANSKYSNADTPEDKATEALHIALHAMNKYFKRFNPDEVAVMFEGKDNWRKAYTKSDACISKRVYKANRIKDDTLLPFYELLESFEHLIRNHSSIICLQHDRLEGDDLLAGYVQRYCGQGDEVIAVSNDKDFVQLLQFENFTLINPDKDVPRSLLDVCGEDDALYFMFEKAIRGDSGDNVMSAYPRLRKDKIKKCMTDDYMLTQILNDTWTKTDPDTGDVTTYKVGDLVNENILLMDLTAQPPEIRELIESTLDECTVNHGKYNHFNFQKFCGKHNLIKIADSADQFVKLFSVTNNKKQKEMIKY